MDFPTRRIITGRDREGRSVVVADGPAKRLGSLYEMWATSDAPADYGSEDEISERWVQLEPPERGTIFRFFRVDPEDPALDADEVERRVARGFASIGAAHCRPDTTRSPHMHQTRTVDYIIVQAARQLRAETITYGLARALEGISSLVLRLSERSAPLARHPWPEIHQPTPKT
jgi:hypothetical protein